MSKAVFKEFCLTQRKRELKSTKNHPDDDLILLQADFIRRREPEEPDDGLCEVCKTVDFDAIFSAESYADMGVGQFTTFFRRQTVDLFQPDCAVCKMFARVMAGWSCPEYQTGFLIRADTDPGVVDIRMRPIPETDSDSDEQPEGPSEEIWYESFDRRSFEKVCATAEATVSGSTSAQQGMHNEIDFAWLTAEIASCVKIHDHPLPPGIDRGNGMVVIIDCIKRQVVRISSRADYVCLSYVWGHGPPEDLTENPYLDRLGCLKQTPRAIEDAIQVVLKLGERYLWVDRYCISQLDPNEQAAEMEAMPQIFAGAKVTIVALGPDDEAGLRGVSVPRDPSPHAYTAQGRMFLSDDRTMREVERSAWYTRAWTLQEAFLAKCLILFLSSETVFVCTTLTLSQVDSRIIRQSEDKFRWWRPKSVDFHSAFPAYTSRALTYEKDSLAAFRGYLNALEVPCFWGVPTRPYTALHEALNPLEAGFAANLLWRNGVKRGSLSPVLASRKQSQPAPSWSWVSCRPRAMAPRKDSSGEFCMIHTCSVLFPSKDSVWCSARDFFEARAEPQPVIEVGSGSILLTGIRSFFDAKYTARYEKQDDDRFCFFACYPSEGSAVFRSLPFAARYGYFEPEIREPMNLENFDLTYMCMSDIEAVLIAIDEVRLIGKGNKEHYRSFWMTLEVGKRREDGITPARRTGLIESRITYFPRIEMLQLLASLDTERVTYELS